MDFSETLAAVNAMSIDDRLRLVEAIWDGIEAEEPAPELTEAQKRELDGRMAEHEANPGSAIPWDEVKARLNAKRDPGVWQARSWSST